MKFYKDINSQYRCAVDVGIMASAFDDFLIQNQLNLYNVLDLSNILDPSVAAKFTFSYTRHALVRPDQIDRQVAFGDAHARRLVSDLAPQILVIEVNQRSKPGQARLTASGQLETLEQAHERTYRELFDLWTRLVRPALRTDGSAYTLADFDLATAAFDIEGKTVKYFFDLCVWRAERMLEGCATFEMCAGVLVCWCVFRLVLKRSQILASRLHTIARRSVTRSSPRCKKDVAKLFGRLLPVYMFKDGRVSRLHSTRHGENFSVRVSSPLFEVLVRRIR